MPIKKSVVGLSALLLLSLGCARSRAKTPLPQLTSAEYRTSYGESEAAASAITRGAYEQALTLANRAIATSPDNPWGHYDRAVALQHLRQTDAAAAAYREAEARFASLDRWGKAISIYGRARAFAEAGRCEDAGAAYREYAEFVRSFEPTAVDMALEYARQCRPRESFVPDPAMTTLSSAVIAGDPQEALEAADHVSEPAKLTGWFDYNRGVALERLGRVDDAVAAFRSAESRFGDENRHGHAIAIYGRARALNQAGRCNDARPAYEEYAAFVRSTDPRDAEMALEVSRACVTR